jgi:hypothetical protein
MPSSGRIDIVYICARKSLTGLLLLVVCSALLHTTASFVLRPTSRQLSKSIQRQQLDLRFKSPDILYTRSAMPSLSAFAIDDALLDQIMSVAIDASKKAGDIIMGNAGGAEVTNRKANSRDLLTLIDPMCEKVSNDAAVKLIRLSAVWVIRWECTAAYPISHV